MARILTPEERKKRLIQRLTPIASIIREAGEISIIELSIETGYSLKTLKYEILPQLEALFKDIVVKGDKVVSESSEGGASE